MNIKYLFTLFLLIGSAVNSLHCVDTEVVLITIGNLGRRLPTITEARLRDQQLAVLRAHAEDPDQVIAQHARSVLAGYLRLAGLAQPVNQEYLREARELYANLQEHHEFLNARQVEDNTANYITMLRNGRGGQINAENNALADRLTRNLGVHAANNQDGFAARMRTVRLPQQPTNNPAQNNREFEDTLG